MQLGVLRSVQARRWSVRSADGEGMGVRCRAVSVSVQVGELGRQKCGVRVPCIGATLERTAARFTVLAPHIPTLTSLSAHDSDLEHAGRCSLAGDTL